MSSDELYLEEMIQFSNTQVTDCLMNYFEVGLKFVHELMLTFVINLPASL